MVNVRLEPEENRAAAYEGNTLVGLCQYKVSGNAWDIYHTEVDPAFGGQGIAGKLAETVLAAADAAGAEVIPTCSYIAHYLEKHGR